MTDNETRLELAKLRMFKDTIVGWRELDHPEGFSRRTAYWLAEQGKQNMDRVRLDDSTVNLEDQDPHHPRIVVDGGEAQSCD